MKIPALTRRASPRASLALIGVLVVAGTTTGALAVGGALSTESTKRATASPQTAARPTDSESTQALLRVENTR